MGDAVAYDKRYGECNKRKVLQELVLLLQQNITRNSFVTLA
jgi:hypothetical protein